MLISIQIARAIAVLAVMSRHLEWVYNDIHATATSWNSPLLLIGGHGVDLFFCISGFIIAYLLSERKWTITDFLLRRFVRIFPLYWLFTLTYLGAVWIGCETGQRNDCGELGGFSYLLSSLLILPQQTFPALSVGWSLEHEIIFYAIAGAVCVAAGRSTEKLLAVLLLLGSIGIVLDVAVPAFFGQAFWSYDLFSPYHFQFAAGVAVFLFQRSLLRLNPFVMVALGLLAFWTTHELGTTTPGPGQLPENWQSGLATLASVLGYALASAAILVGLVGAETRGYFKGTSKVGSLCIGALVLIGNASYSLYLMQPIAYGVMGKAFAWVFSPSLMVPALLLAVLATVIAGTAWYLLVERPFLHLTHRALIGLRVPEPSIQKL